MSGQIRYLILLVGWFALFWLPIYAGDWWDEHYHVYQALTSLAVIGMARKLFPLAWWADDLAVVAMLQILHAGADFAFPGDSGTYDLIQVSLNGLELFFLLAGGCAELFHGRSGAGSRRNSRPDSDRGSERRGHA